MSILDEFENAPPIPHLKMNESSQTLQNGSSAVISWNQALNCPDSVTEIISWPRDGTGAILAKPRYDRRGTCFTIDKQHYNIARKVNSSELDRPFDRGHLRAANNCFNPVDFRASFSNLNYVAQNCRLNQCSWKLLEEHVLRTARMFKEAYVTTGPIFNDGEKVDFIKGMLIK